MKRALPLVLLLALSGCGSDRAPVQVGAKDFAEQRILATMLVELLRAAEIPAAVANCGDTYGCQRALRTGEVDLMVDYTGTGLNFVGAPPADGQDALMQLNAQYGSAGLEWSTLLGFDNGYRVVVATERAAGLGVQQIDQLDRFRSGVRVAAPREFLRRPGDGLAALVRRYGIRTQGDPLVVDDPAARFEALLDGRADVAIGYATDGAIEALGLTILRDPLGFFPSYAGALVARTDLSKRAPGAAAAVAALADRLPTGVMRQLNYAVQVEGRAPEEVAERFLLDNQLVGTPAEGSRRARSTPELVVARGADERLDTFAAQGHRAVRKVFGGRPVLLKEVRDPVSEVAEGGARLAIVGAERFFRRRAGAPARDERLEAVAVLGTRMLHVLRRSGDTADPLGGRMGIAPRGTGAGEVGEALARASGARVTSRATVDALVKGLRGDEIDAALVLAAPGDADLVSALRAGGVELAPLSNWWNGDRALRFPYFRPSRIPRDTYAGQAAALETVGAQVLIAAPTRRHSGGIAQDGPVGALAAGALPLAQSEVKALAEATRVPEAPDPALPSAWSVPVGDHMAADDSAGRAAFDTFLNILAFLFLGWLARLAVTDD
jgi:osmoprotectant transport system substrate-binding protein